MRGRPSQQQLTAGGFGHVGLRQQRTKRRRPTWPKRAAVSCY